MKKLMRVVIVLSFCGWTLSCGPQNGFNSKTNSADSSGNQSQGGAQPPGTPTTPTISDAELWNQIGSELSGKADGVGNETLIGVEPQDETIVLYFPFQFIPIVAGTIVSSQDPTIKVEVTVTEQNKTVIAVRIPFKKVFGNKSTMSPMSTLPSGDPLPDFPAGEVRGFTIQISSSLKIRSNLYFGPEAIGVFFETPGFDLPGSITWATSRVIFNSTKTRRIGAYRFIPKKGNFSGGFYIMAAIPVDTSLKLKRLIRF